MLDRFKNAVVTLRLLVVPNSSVLYFMLDRFKNPVVALELSKRHKNKAYIRVMYAVYAVYVLSSFFVLVDVVKKTWRYYPLFSYSSVYPDVSAVGFTVLPVVGMIFLVVPVLAAVSVVGEHRRGTLMPVQLSLLRPFDIVWGKVVASVAPVLFPVAVCVVVLASFSLSSLVVNMDEANVYRLFGSVLGGPGVGVGLVVLSMAVSVVCVLCSTFAKSSASAIAMSYGQFFAMILVWGLFDQVVVSVVFSLGVWIIGLPFWCLWVCRRLRLPAKK